MCGPDDTLQSLMAEMTRSPTATSVDQIDAGLSTDTANRRFSPVRYDCLQFAVQPIRRPVSGGGRDEDERLRAQVLARRTTGRGSDRVIRRGPLSPSPPPVAADIEPGPLRFGGVGEPLWAAGAFGPWARIPAAPGRPATPSHRSLSWPRDALSPRASPGPYQRRVPDVHAGETSPKQPVPTRRAVRRVAVVALGLLLSACGTAARNTNAPAAPPQYTVAFLRAVASDQQQNQAAFLQVLHQAGYQRDVNLTLLGADPAEVHAAPADAEATVRAWATARLDLVVALSTASAAAARTAAPTVPVLFLSNDPVGGGLLRDLRRPEGQLTGVTFRVPPDRTLDFARRALPSLRRIGLLYPPRDVAASAIRSGASQAADQLRIGLVEATFVDGDDVGGAVQMLRSQEADAIWALNSPTTARFFSQIASAGSNVGLPTITNTAADFAVVILQPDVQELYRQMARQALRLLAGDAVVDIPVEDPVRFSFEVNLRAAAAFGFDIPPDVVTAADRVVR